MLKRQEKRTALVFHDKGSMLLGGDCPHVANPLESCGFAVPELQLALASHCSGGQLVCAQSDGETLLTAVLRKRLLMWESWETPLSPSGVPAIAEHAADVAISGLLEGLSSPVLLRQLPVKGQAFALLQDKAAQLHVLNRWQRAGLNTQGTFETWMQVNFDHKRRKELKRQRARLSEQGTLQTERLTSAEELSSYIDDFLRLEQASWKGGKGTALAQDSALAAALREGLSSLFRNGKLRFWRLVFDGKAIASLFAFVEKGRATLGKIAFDEAFSKSSPGVMIIIDATADFFADPAIHVADANAIPGHPMIDRIWRDRLEMVDVMAAGPGVPEFKFKAILHAEMLRIALRRFAKSMYYRVKGGKTS
jgi:Acetyltransferase (GNAT) domain